MDFFLGFYKMREGAKLTHYSNRSPQNHVLIDKPQNLEFPSILLSNEFNIKQFPRMFTKVLYNYNKLLLCYAPILLSFAYSFYLRSAEAQHN